MGGVDEKAGMKSFQDGSDISHVPVTAPSPPTL